MVLLNEEIVKKLKHQKVKVLINDHFVLHSGY